MSGTTRHVPIVQHILSANDEIAQQNRLILDEAGTYAINIMASPGAGKTSVILATFERVKEVLRLGMINGDIATSIDADKASDAGMPSVAINTGGNCHLEANMLRGALAQIDLKTIDLLLVENVGNLVCPAGWDLGTHLNVLVASVPEGDDKPYKYPSMYRNVQALIINKVDLAPYIDFKMDYFIQGVEVLNPGLVTFPMSARTGEGVDDWVSWLKEQVKAHQHGG